MNEISADPVFFVGVCRWWFRKRFSINDLRNAYPQTQSEATEPSGERRLLPPSPLPEGINERKSNEYM